MVTLGRYRRLARTFQRQRRPVQLAVVEATVLLAVARLAVRLVPFKYIERRLGPRMSETSPDLSADDLDHVRTVSRAIRLVSPHTMWTSNCLPQAIAAKSLLRRRGVGSTLYIGAALEPIAGDLARRDMRAHAWLRAGTVYVTGGDGSTSFGAIVTYG